MDTFNLYFIVQIKSTWKGLVRIRKWQTRVNKFLSSIHYPNVTRNEGACRKKIVGDLRH